MNNSTSLFDEQFNRGWYNITDPFNSSLGDIDNTNASRHFADDPHLTDIFHLFPMTIILIISAIPCGLIIIGSIIFWLKDCTRLHRMPRSSRRTETDYEASLGGSCRPDLLSIVQNGVTDQMIFQNGDDLTMMDTPSSIYPGDMLPNYSDSTRNLYTDVITTPLSNNSVITMIMRNNHLIIETEERVPVSCTMMTNEELYRSNLSNKCVSFVSVNADDDFQISDTMDDDTTSYSDDNFPNLCTMGGGGGSGSGSGSGSGDDNRKLFYEPTTSRQADEEDQHVELFHKKILAFPRGHEQYSHETDTVVPSCSYDRSEERYSSRDAVNTGLTQSDLTGSSSSTSRRARIEYAYSNQCEYVSSEFPQRKRSYSLKMLTTKDENSGAETGKRDAIFFPRHTGASMSPEDSVLQVTDCSSPEYSEPSK